MSLVWINSAVTIVSSSITRTKTHFQPSYTYKSRDKLIFHPLSSANRIRHRGSHTNQNSLLCSYNLIRIGFWSSRSPPCPLNVQPTLGQPHHIGEPVQNLIDYFWNPSAKQYTTPSKTKIFGPFSLCKRR